MAFVRFIFQRLVDGGVLASQALPAQRDKENQTDPHQMVWSSLRAAGVLSRFLASFFLTFQSDLLQEAISDGQQWMVYFGPPLEIKFDYYNCEGLSQNDGVGGNTKLVHKTPPSTLRKCTRQEPEGEIQKKSQFTALESF
ncbi:uncharacterized protein ACOB8E_016214 isoform 1-T1 [Sarcophilus harrisii]